MKRSISIRDIIAKIVCWVLLLQVINISIDPPDYRQPNTSDSAHKQISAVNDTESIYEMVAEGLFDQDIPEDEGEEIDKSSSSIDLYFFPKSINLPPAINFSADYISYYLNKFPTVHQEPQFPPPKFT